ncbi:outer membrane lipoprotein carrier protein LolA [Melioribacteraceae bacterium 4301-Me]|uniref:LolA family protein n=1 Tax=Pyranulibacter aquaticus TaxID=3163344 RepID=UPI00359505C3
MIIRSLILFFISTLLFPQSGKSILTKLQQKYSNIKTFSASFQQKIKGQNNFEVNAKGKFYYSQKNKFIIEFNNQVIVSDGNTVWNYNKKSKQVIISSITDEPTSLSIDRIIYDYPSICNVTLEKNSDKNPAFTVLMLTPKDEDAPFKDVKIWVTQDYLINKLEISDLSGSTFIFELSNIELNKDLSNMDFVFTPPKGVRVIDLR